MNMYPEQLKAITRILDALNASDASDLENTYAQSIPIFTDSELIGFCSDEISGSYSFHVATETERAWWNSRPR